MSGEATATARIAGTCPDDLLSRIATLARQSELDVSVADGTLRVTLHSAKVDLAQDGGGLFIDIRARDAATLSAIREFLLHMLDHAAPGLTDLASWQGDIARNRAPLNFSLATVRRTWRAAPNFLRIELDCPDTPRLATGGGMHFSLLLPPGGRAPVWPRLDGGGRTVWPRGQDALHRAAYTFVDLWPEAGRFTFDLFEHEGGRATAWAKAVRPGETVGITGPGSGDFPPGANLLIAGDETAFPAIRRILERSDPARQGDVLIEVGGAQDICAVPAPGGMRLRWVRRDCGETLWDHLRDMSPPAGPDRYVWIAAEKDLVRKAKARFKGEFGLGPDEGYFAYYWTAAPSRTPNDLDAEAGAS
ncbi:siderophore-interacting protein [Tropicimonas sp. IMCC34011]|uniref:siderophore-interacting protein n=1 Tax=Tropicimonas sp. IMCC34011 TaxID=2248759 RepID=UPI000E25EF14|nr:siderophore-interacting protein [Tropicimonas sp. IMCC34011]